MFCTFVCLHIVLLAVADVSWETGDAYRMANIWSHGLEYTEHMYSKIYSTLITSIKNVKMLSFNFKRKCFVQPFVAYVCTQWCVYIYIYVNVVFISLQLFYIIIYSNYIILCYYTIFFYITLHLVFNLLLTFKSGNGKVKLERGSGN